MKKWVLWMLFFALAMLIGYLSWPRHFYESNIEGQNFTFDTNWNTDTVEYLKNYTTQANHVDAFVALRGEQMIFASGKPQQLINLHSLRKPLISLLFGIAKEKGLLRLDETLGELGIAEVGVELSTQEASATIKDLLMAKSGIYLTADAEIISSKDKRPSRGAFKPGTHYFYNNFDFNVLGTILQLKTGMDFGTCLYQWLAIPLEMQEFRPENVSYGTPFSSLKTDHPAYRTWMSARDLAKIGAMLAQGGKWKGQQIVSTEWIKESMQAQHFFAAEDFRWPLHAYGYLWHMDTLNNNIWGTGYGGQWLLIDTTRALTLVQRHYTGNSLLSQGLYLQRNTQSSQVDVMNVWYSLLRNWPD